MGNIGEKKARNDNMKGRVFIYDLIRCIAIIFVIIIHSMACLNEGKDDIAILMCQLYNSIVNVAVPLFVLLSGALLLNKKDSVNLFFRKRFKRLLLPFIIWSIIVFGIYILTGERQGNVIDLLNLFFNEFTTNGVHGIYWYIYMIIGVYLFAPLFQRMVSEASFMFMTYVFFLFFILICFAPLFPTIKLLERFNSENLIFLGYFVSGYYIVNYLQYKKYFTAISIISFVLFWIANYFNVMFHFTLFPFIYPLSISFFTLLLLLKNNNAKNIILVPISYISQISYGIYLSHFIFISAIIKTDYLLVIPIYVRPLVISFCVLILEIIMFQLFDRLRISKYLM